MIASEWIARVRHNLQRTRCEGLLATLTIEEWTQTIADFAGLCAYCQSASIEELEHFIPRSRGGGTTPGNCLPSCKPCNRRKGWKMPDEIGAFFGADRVEILRDYLSLRSLGEDANLKPLAARPSNGLDKQVAVRLKPALHKDLEAMAEELGSTPSAILRAAGEAAVARWKRKKQRE